MKILVTIALCFIILFTAVAQQKSIDEDKVKKAVVLMQKMMTDPGQMQTVMTELQALKLNSAENKEAQTRLQQQAISQTNSIKKRQYQQEEKLNSRYDNNRVITYR